MHPRLHLLSSYLLPSVSIRADCCHFRPVHPCISFLILPLSLQHTVPSVFLNQSLSWKNRQAPLHWHHQGLKQWGVYTTKALCSPAISKRHHRQYCWTSGRFKNRPTSDLLDTRDKSSPTLWLRFYQKDTLYFIMCQCVRENVSLANHEFLCVSYFFISLKLV